MPNKENHMPIRQSYCYPLYKSEQITDRELFEKTKAMGYQAVEIWDRGMFPDYRAIFDAAREAGLVIASMGGHNSLPDGMNKPENHDRIRNEIAKSIEIAVEYEIPGLICFSGNRNSGQSDLEGMRECARVLRKVAPAAEGAGVNLNMELLNSTVNHPGYQCDSSDWGFTLCEMVGSTKVKLLYDIYHMQIMEGDIIRTIRRGIDYIGHFHTAGNPGRNDMDDTQELNYRGICAAIAETGYDLYVGHEFKPKGDILEALQSAYETCAV